jgi:hypothetical protein
MKIILSKEASQIFADIAVMDLYPKILEERKQQRKEVKNQIRSEQHGSTSATSSIHQ